MEELDLNIHVFDGVFNNEHNDDDGSAASDEDIMAPAAAIPEPMLVAHEAIRERVDIEALKGILEQAPEDETRGRPLLRLIKFAMRCNQERSLQEGILELLIERDTECTKIADELGGFLLHTACKCAAPIEVVKYILELYPDAARVPIEDGQFPLHFACAIRKPHNSEFLDAARCASRNKILPLHVALNKGAVEIVFQLLNAFPESAGIKAQNEELALHLACRTNMPLEVIKRLVELYPKGIHAKDCEGSLPLHRACWGNNSVIGRGHSFYAPIHLERLLLPFGGASLEVAQYLLEQKPSGASTIDVSGMIPLHYAAWNGALELAIKLLERFPGGIHAQDYDGKLPLHLACDNESNEALVRLLVDRYPASLKEKDKLQCIPLHYAAAQRMPKTDTLKLLLERFPEGVYVLNCYGHLPLHYAVKTHGVEQIRVIVDVDPFTVTAKTVDGKSPLQLACLANRHLEIKQYLMEAQMNCVQEIREAFNYATGDLCGFPDALQAIMWSYADPGLYQPSQEDLEGEEDELDSDEDLDDDDLPDLDVSFLSLSDDDDDDDIPDLLPDLIAEEGDEQYIGTSN